jgi:chemotaxis protein MotB
MSIRKRSASADNHERWLVSYADFITLLFAFFVVMFASTQTDKSRAKAVSAAVSRALRDGTLAPKVAAILGGTTHDKGKGSAMMHGPGGTERKKSELGRDLNPSPDLASSMNVLADQLQQEIKDQKVKLRLEPRGLIIGLEAAAFFPSGGDTIEPSSYPTIAKLAAVLQDLPNPLRLEGHTDSIPINTSRFRSNWELSAARSIAMLRLLNEQFEITSKRMAVIGYADTDAVDSNETSEGRARNRRVDIVIVSEYGMRAEPEQATSAFGEAKKN